ncbi:LptF/LptG family permease [Synechococcus sp. 65AY6Li]|uniref:LptF/LptG family permease n=1 Tax=Synechococcus sp. 65AY6Li TaxID=1351840 RepID=UPI001F0B2D96|nr:LptF/LptG family permease [Synechococcus sp. 65AY6Li]
MDRYIISEMLLPFFFGVGAFTTLVMAVGSLFELVRLVVEAGLSLSAALQVFVLRAPGIIVLTFPMSMLLATLLAYGRLSADNEITALRGCGVSLYRLVVPALLLSLLVTTLTFLFNELVVPVSNRQAALTLNRALNRTPEFRRENILYQEFGEILAPEPDGTFSRRQGLTRQFYARSFDGQEMRGVIVLDVSNEALSQILLAQRGRWDPQENLWVFEEGTNYIVSPDGTYSNIATFARQELRLPRAPLDLAQEVRSPEEMNIPELRRYLEVLASSGDLQRVRRLQVNLSQKYAIPFACLAFTLIGAPLGLRPQRTSSSLGLGLSVLIIFAYYVLLFVSQALGQIGTLGPEVAAWLPNCVCLGIGGALLYRANR